MRAGGGLLSTTSDTRRSLYIQFAGILIVLILCVRNFYQYISNDHGSQRSGVRGWVWKTETTYSWTAIADKVREEHNKLAGQGRFACKVSSSSEMCCFCSFCPNVVYSKPTDHDEREE